MQRRQFLKGAGTILALGAVAGCSGRTLAEMKREEQMARTSNVWLATDEMPDEIERLTSTTVLASENVPYRIELSHDGKDPRYLETKDVQIFLMPADVNTASVTLKKLDNSQGEKGLVTADISRGGYMYDYGESSHPETIIKLHTNFTKAK
ncbi:twin-arginine translocation signal domain-containing protein [Haladaptatus salinisoli]|uniref:twin-arginine translocation signal domain-containing protein n=1 Tax=Haladaptatus salinisoli TaxID=2884876 RepID=UPI001D0BBE4F|nr:twin-arginine translocation signal domain-containing protein [Haladaptatus salinisoli]